MSAPSAYVIRRAADGLFWSRHKRMWSSFASARFFESRDRALASYIDCFRHGGGVDPMIEQGEVVEVKAPSPDAPVCACWPKPTLK